MFLRSNHRIKDGKDHTYWSLVETVRTPDGPRQRTLCYLGELNGSAQARWLKTIEVFNEQGEAEQLKLFPSHIEPPEDDPQVARVLLNQVRLERTRQFGACYLGLELWKRLELDHFFEEAIDKAPADVPWSRIAALLTINRLCAPGSELMVIALIVNSEGFPFSYETFDGNRADVSTVETILRMVERKYGKARRIWIFDRGIVSEENLAAIRKRGGQYLVGTPRRHIKRFEAELVKEDWTRVRPEVEVKKVAIPQGEETYILCRTAGRREKEKAIRERFCSRMEEALKRLEKTMATGRLKNRNLMERRLGKIQARHPSVNDLYEISLRETGAGVRLSWHMREDRRRWHESREGAYLLRTNLQAETPEELWSKYMQLTEAEASFRALKSELSIRPLFHQKERRVKAHVMVAFLGYALWVTLKHLLQRRPALIPKPAAADVGNTQPLTPMQALALLSKLHSGDIVLPTTDGREIRLRRVTEPTAEQKSLLDLLGSSLPDRLSFNRQCSVDSAIA